MKVLQVEQLNDDVYEVMFDWGKETISVSGAEIAAQTGTGFTKIMNETFLNYIRKEAQDAHSPDKRKRGIGAASGGQRISVSETEADRKITDKSKPHESGSDRLHSGDD